MRGLIILFCKVWEINPLSIQAVPKKAKLLKNKCVYLDVSQLDKDPKTKEDYKLFLLTWNIFIRWRSCCVIKISSVI